MFFNKWFFKKFNIVNWKGEASGLTDLPHLILDTSQYGNWYYPILQTSDGGSEKRFIQESPKSWTETELDAELSSPPSWILTLHLISHLSAQLIPKHTLLFKDNTAQSLGMWTLTRMPDSNPSSAFYKFRDFGKVTDISGPQFPHV